MAENRRGKSHAHCLTVHIVWVTKYRYHVPGGGDSKAMSRTADPPGGMLRICAFSKVLSAKITFICSLSILRPNLISEIGSMAQRPHLEAAATGISRASETILGQAFLGDWLYMEYCAKSKWCRNIWRIIAIRPMQTTTTFCWSKRTSVQPKPLHF